MSTDLHHPFENIIGYSQVFHLGQVPFRNYIPVSGMYSIIHGAVFDWFGEGGTFANYNIASNLFYLFIVILITSLLWHQADRMDCFLIALIFSVIDYSRVVFILPVMLLLTLPSIVAKKGLWLRLWILTSLFQGLYYPLYGAAVCLSFAPFGLYQAFCYVKAGELRGEMRTVGFWVKWGICILLPVLCIPFLAGTLRHVLAMSSQSVLADGIPRFGQLLPNNFLPYLREGSRLVLYDLLTFMIPAGLVWLSFALTCKAGDVSVEGKRCRVKNPQAACQMISVGIMLGVAYTFTFMRLDIGSIYARSQAPIYAGAVILILMVRRYIDNRRYRMGIMLLFVALAEIANNAGVNKIETNAKLMPYVTVPTDYIYVVDDEIERLGQGFIKQDTYETLHEFYEQYSSGTTADSCMGTYPSFGYYYLFDIKGDGVIEMNTAKGFDAAQEAADTARTCGSTVGMNLSPLLNYYMYHWLLASGEYVWDADTYRFYPNRGRYTAEEIRTLNKDTVVVGDGANYGKYTGSLGESMESLEDIFTDVGIGWNVSAEENADVISLSRAVNGDEADWLYLEFDGMEEKFEYTQFDMSGEVAKIAGPWSKYFMKKNYNPGMRVQIGWVDDNGENHTVSCAMNKGKLLIPLGAGVKWLFHEHDSISVSVYQNEETVVIPEINEVRFLKLREVR